MKKLKTKFKVGDRVLCPIADNIPGTVIEVGYNNYTKVKWDDGEVSMSDAGDLVSVDSCQSLQGR